MFTLQICVTVAKENLRYFKGNVEHVHMVTFNAHTDDICKICSKVSILLLSIQNFNFSMLFCGTCANLIGNPTN